jgi:hypothetical protein
MRVTRRAHRDLMDCQRPSPLGGEALESATSLGDKIIAPRPAVTR